MGRPLDAGRNPVVESSCCSCKSWSWLLYLLVMLSLSLSVMVFWMSLYKQQEISLELQRLHKAQNETIAEKVAAQIAPVRWELSKMGVTSEKHQEWKKRKGLPNL